MEFDGHGDVEFSRKGEIFIIRFYHNWNLEGAKAFFKEYQTCIDQAGLERFGILSDLRQFQGGTPDAIEFFREIGDWAQAKGQIARALVLDSGLKEFTVHQIDRERTRFQVRSFSGEVEALEWLESLGLALS